MPSHLSSLGFVVADEAGLFELAQRVGPEADPIDTPAGIYYRWADPSGAELWLQTTPDGEQFLGARPHLSGAGRVRITLRERVLPVGEASPLDGAIQGDTGGEPVLFDCPDFRRWDRLTLPAEAQIQLCGFAHEAEGFASPATFEAATEGKLKPAVRSLIAVGLLDSGPARPLTFAAGLVTAAEWRTNRFTGERFGVADLDTSVGSVVVALDPTVLSDLPPVGGVLAGTFWLSGRVVG